MEEQLANYLGIPAEDILEYKERGDVVNVITVAMAKFFVPIAEMEAHPHGDDPDVKVPDDLTVIDGLGEASVKKLNEKAGIFTFADLLAADSEETAVSCALSLTKLREWQMQVAVFLPQDEGAE